MIQVPSLQVTDINPVGRSEEIYLPKILWLISDGTRNEIQFLVFLSHHSILPCPVFPDFSLILGLWKLVVSRYLPHGKGLNILKYCMSREKQAHEIAVNGLLCVICDVSGILQRWCLALKNHLCSLEAEHGRLGDREQGEGFSAWWHCPVFPSCSWHLVSSFRISLDRKSVV